jgi:hypothetical protein
LTIGLQHGGLVKMCQSALRVSTGACTSPGNRAAYPRFQASRSYRPQVFSLIQRTFDGVARAWALSYYAA